MIRRLLITLVLMAAAYYAGYHRITWEDAGDWWRDQEVPESVENAVESVGDAAENLMEETLKD
jgi:hypothetical protein